MFGDFTAVDNLSLQVQPGEFSRSSVLADAARPRRCACWRDSRSRRPGTLLISGSPVQGVPPHKRNVNTVFQAYGLFPHMSVAENVAYGLRQKKVAKAGDAAARC